MYGSGLTYPVGIPRGGRGQSAPCSHWWTNASARRCRPAHRSAAFFAVTRTVYGRPMNAARRVAATRQTCQCCGGGAVLWRPSPCAECSTADRSCRSPVRAGTGLRDVSPEESAAQVLAGERALQVDLAGRLTYRFDTKDGASSGEEPLGRPYVGVGFSRYHAGTFGYDGGRPPAPSTSRSTLGRKPPDVAAVRS